MILNEHSDAFYLSATKARCCVEGYLFLGSLPINGKAIQLNGNSMITCKILKLVASSVVEAELGALFVKTKKARILRLTLYKLRHPQPPTPIHIDNTRVIGVKNNTIHKRRSRANEVQSFWLLDQMAQQYFKFYYQPGQENLADYPTKHRTSAIHHNVQPYYI